MKKIGIAIAILFYTIQTFSQKTHTYQDPELNYQQAIENFKDKHYPTALSQFRNLLKNENEWAYFNKVNTSFFEAMCLKELKNKEAEKKWEDFIDLYPESSYIDEAHYQLATIYFNNKEYEKAIAEYALIQGKLSPAQEEERLFNQGYALFIKKKYKESVYYFQNISQNQNSVYYSDANYYLGFVQYKDDQYKESLKAFEKIDAFEKYRKVVPYYIVNLHAQLGEEDAVIEKGNKYSSISNLAYKNDIQYLVGQALFNQKKYEDALPKLQEYVESSNKVRKHDIYQLAFTQYQLKKYEDASKNFSQLSTQEDTLGQNASFHLGDCYLQMGNKNKAMSAFQVASKYNFDDMISENASFQAVKLSAETKQKNAIDGIQNFLRKFPNSKYSSEAKEILTEVYLNSSNYDEALKAMENIPDKSNKIKKSYQQTAFIKAIELYNNQKYPESNTYFEKSKTYPVNNDLYSQSLYWQGEIAYQTSNYNNAIDKMSNYLNSSSSLASINTEASRFNALYTLGYAYLKLEKYDQSIAQFQNILSIFDSAPAKYKTDVNILKINSDAQLRLADCFFKGTDYTSARTYYNNVKTTGNSDAPYACYQLALIQGLQGFNTEKISELNTMISLYPKSKYIDDAIYELGKTNYELNNSANAISSYQSLIEKYPSSPLIMKAKNNLALIYINQNDNSKALNLYKEVISKNTKSKESNEAIEGIKNIYIQKNDPDGYINYLSKNTSINLSESAKDTLLFTNAENIYTNSDCDQAINALDSYLNQFPNGNFSMTARYYRGDCSYKKKDFVKAYEDMSYIADVEDNIFSEKALLIAGKIAYYERKDYNKSFEYFKRLMNNSNYKENIQPARKGMMESAYKLSKYDETIELANQILTTSEPSKDELTVLYFYLGQSYYAKNEMELAKGNFKRMESYVKNAYTAEGQYMLAKIMYENNEFDSAKDQCMKISSEYNDYEYWLVKSFILLADIAVAQKEYFQAKATLQSILDGYEGDKEILEICAEKMKNVEKIEAENTKIESPNQDTIIEMPNTNE